MASYNVLMMGASYGSLLASKLLFGGHSIVMVCLPAEVEAYNRDGARVRMPIRGLKEPIELDSRKLPGSLRAAGPGDVDPTDYDLVVLAMQEPQYRSPGVRELLDAVARKRVPCMSIMNMPPLPYLKRIPGLAIDPLKPCYTDATVWDNFEPGLLTLCSPDPQAIRPLGEKINMLQVTLPTNFKAARFAAEAPTAILRQMQREIEAVRYDPGDGTAIDLPVKLKVHESIFVPLAKWAMLMTGNYRCVTQDGAISIKDAVHRDLAASRSVYDWVCAVCRELGASPDDLVPFEKYAAAANDLMRPSSAARELFNGALDIERTDLLVQRIGAQIGMHHPIVDQTVAQVDARLTIAIEAGLKLRAAGGLGDRYTRAVARAGRVWGGLQIRSSDRAADQGEKWTAGAEPDAQVVKERLVAQPVSRYTDIDCPRRVWLKTPRFSVSVRLTVQPSEYTAALENLAVEGASVQVCMDAPDFDMLSAPDQDITVLPAQDSNPIVFYLRPRQAGDFRCKFHFFQGGNPLGSVSVPVECTFYEVATEVVSAPKYSFLMDPNAESPDLVLHIGWQDLSRTLTFRLYDKSAAKWRSFTPIRLSSDVVTEALGLYKNLTDLAVRAEPADPNKVRLQAIGEGAYEYVPLPAELDESRHETLSPHEVDARVKDLGQNLWYKLIPDDLKRHYDLQREDWFGRDCSMLILSDEPHLPWELTWPYSNEWEDEMPWCGTFRLTRWLGCGEQGRDIVQAPARVRLRAIDIFAPVFISGDLALPYAQHESGDLQEWGGRNSVTVKRHSPAACGALRQMLREGDYSWLHISTHGEFRPDSFGSEAVIWLQGDDSRSFQSFTPDWIVGRIQQQIVKRRPALIFNACHGGRLRFSLRGMDGWATRLVGSGASLFLGALWAINDETSRAFSTAFYEAIESETVGAAVRKARLAVKKSGDPTWLAYTIYAHPNATVTFQGE